MNCEIGTLGEAAYKEDSGRVAGSSSHLYHRNLSTSYFSPNGLRAFGTVASLPVWSWHRKASRLGTGCSERAGRCAPLLQNRNVMAASGCSDFETTSSLVGWHSSAFLVDQRVLLGFPLAEESRVYCFLGGIVLGWSF